MGVPELSRWGADFRERELADESCAKLCKNRRLSPAIKRKVTAMGTIQKIGGNQKVQFQRILFLQRRENAGGAAQESFAAAAGKHADVALPAGASLPWALLPKARHIRTSKRQAALQGYVGYVPELLTGSVLNLYIPPPQSLKQKQAGEETPGDLMGKCTRDQPVAPEEPEARPHSSYAIKSPNGLSTCQKLLVVYPTSSLQSLY